MPKVTIKPSYGAWVAEDVYGNTIWARSRDKLERLFTEGA